MHNAQLRENRKVLPFSVIASTTQRGPHKGEWPLWGEEKPRHSRYFPPAENIELWLVLRRRGNPHLKGVCTIEGDSHGCYAASE